MRSTRPYTYLATVQGMCRQCRVIVPARVIAVDGAVFQERLCPKCGKSRALIADSVEWYAQRAKTTVQCRAPNAVTPSPGVPGEGANARTTEKGTGGVFVRVSPQPSAREEEYARGEANTWQLTPDNSDCPRNCGPCPLHANHCHLPVFSITNACNMACPICFTYNRPDRLYFMPRAELRSLLDRTIERSGPVDLVNITGGEPTLHPDLPELLDECRRPEIGRITINSNGQRLAEDESLCAMLAERGAYVILSLHTLDGGRSRIIHGRDVVDQKLKALANLQRHGIGTTLLNVMIRGLNEDEIGRIIGLAREHSVVRSITVQTMTFTGQAGKDFGGGQRMPLDGAAAAIEIATHGEMRREHFFAHPGAHPLCYSIAYYLRGDGRWRSLTDLLTVDELRTMFGGYLLRADDGGRVLQTALDRLWAKGDDEDLLRRLRMLIERLYPPGESLGAFERQRIAEEQVLSVYLHAHMDEDTLDLGRLMVCPDQVPDANGRMIPACAYNLFYRMRDERFYAPVRS